MAIVYGRLPFYSHLASVRIHLLELLKSSFHLTEKSLSLHKLTLDQFPLTDEIRQLNLVLRVDPLVLDEHLEAQNLVFVRQVMYNRPLFGLLRHQIRQVSHQYLNGLLSQENLRVMAVRVDLDLEAIFEIGNG